MGGHVLRLAILATATKVRSRPAAARLSSTLHAFGKRSRTQPRATACSATEVRSLASCSSKAAFSAVPCFGVGSKVAPVAQVMKSRPPTPIRFSAPKGAAQVQALPFCQREGCPSQSANARPTDRVSGVKHTSQAALSTLTRALALRSSLRPSAREARRQTCKFRPYNCSLTPLIRLVFALTRSAHRHLPWGNQGRHIRLASLVIE